MGLTMVVTMYSRFSVFWLVSTFVSYLASCEPCSYGASSGWCIYSTWMPTNKSSCTLVNCRNQTFFPSVGNGYLSTVVMSDELHVSGVYNGAANVKPGRGGNISYYEHTHYARIPSTVAINFTVVDCHGTYSYALDTYDGLFHQWFVSDYCGVTIHQKIYAHRLWRNVGVNELHVQSSKKVIVKFIDNRGNASLDIDFRSTSFPFHDDMLVSCGSINEPEGVGGPQPHVCVAESAVPEELVIDASNSTTSFYFIMTVVTSLDTYELQPAAMVVSLWKQAFTSALLGELFELHRREWNALWASGTILLEGSDHLSQVITSSLYYILCSIRADWVFGVSPGGISGGEEYLGHVFWDQDMWIYPIILLMYPQLARSFLDYRYERLLVAKDIAKRNGWKGAMFPWESALTGIEVCPGAVYGLHENHITGDIAFAVQQYWLATGDVEWMRRCGWEILQEVAAFWTSRAVYDSVKDRYSINDVMPPDEYQYPVNNSFYTNAIAKENLRFAESIAKLMNSSKSSTWRDVEQKMFLPYDSALSYHPEFEGFNISGNGTLVKQADVILVGYPLMLPVGEDRRKNDLLLYLNVTDDNGPAMTHSMFAIGFLEVGLVGEAFRQFHRFRDNLQEPFKVWTEQTNGMGASNFITAAGGFLQSVAFGYGGFRIREDGLHFNLQIVPSSSCVVYKEIDYFGCTFTMQVNSSTSSIELLRARTRSGEAHVMHDDVVERLSVGVPIFFVIPRGVVMIL